MSQNKPIAAAGLLLLVLGVCWGCERDRAATSPSSPTKGPAQNAGEPAPKTVSPSAYGREQAAAEEIVGKDDFPLAPASPNYSQDVAAIINEHCLVCHREGEAAPFPLATYAQVRDRAEQIVAVTARRYMPPWQPAADGAQYKRSKLLPDGALQTLAKWHAQGCSEGDASQLAPAPQFPQGWQLGQPDMVLQMDGVYKLKADGADVYRSFVLKAPLDRPRWVSALEFRPGNYRVAHHAFMYVDRTGRCRQLDAQDDIAGFESMDATLEGAEKPAAQLLSWQVGRLPSPPQPGISWRLEPGDDMVVELHMQTTGKPEDVQLSLGLFFTEEPPTRHPYILSLVQQEIDIPAGEKAYRVYQEYTLPLDAKALAVLGHAHYLAKQIHAYALLPNGQKEWLLKIDDWDFSWQSDYEFKRPVVLPKGSKIVQDFVYDNSAANPRNPSSPPKRVRFGKQTADEMAELHLQVECDSAPELAKLERDYKNWRLASLLERFQTRLEKNPNDVQALFELGKAEFARGRLLPADQMLTKAIGLDPNNPELLFYKGYVRMTAKDAAGAIEAFRRTVELAPAHYRAQSSMGKVLMDLGRFSEAAREFELALRMNPHDPWAHHGLGVCLAQQKKYAEALPHFKMAYQLKPELTAAKQNAERLEAALQRGG